MNEDMTKEEVEAVSLAVKRKLATESDKKRYEFREGFRKQKTPEKQNSKNQRSVRPRKDSRKMRETTDESSNSETEEFDGDINEGTGKGEYTWSELIIKSIRQIGPATCREITQYIEDHFGELISSKTKTWKNSVMGCLSANTRGLWFKEAAVVNGKRRYLWNIPADKKNSPSKTVVEKKELPFSSPSAVRTLYFLKNGATNGEKSPPSKAPLIELYTQLSSTNESDIVDIDDDTDNLGSVETSSNNNNSSEGEARDLDLLSSLASGAVQRSALVVAAGSLCV